MAFFFIWPMDPDLRKIDIYFLYYLGLGRITSFDTWQGFNIQGLWRLQSTYQILWPFISKSNDANHFLFGEYKYVHFGSDAIALKVQKVCKNYQVRQSLYDEDLQPFPIELFPLDNSFTNDVNEMKRLIRMFLYFTGL